MIAEMMIDFETLATCRNAAVCSLGYTVFNRESVLGSGGWVVNTTSSILAGGVVDQETVDWWKGQQFNAKEAIISGGVPIAEVMSQLAKVWVDSDCKNIWAHGATFDIPIAEFYMQGSQPWDYRDHRDTRTLFDEAKHMGWERPKTPTLYIASADALDQTKHVIEARQFLQGTF